MILALDIGNSQIFCGVFDREELKFKLGTHQRLRFLQTSLVCFLECSSRKWSGSGFD